MPKPENLAAQTSQNRQGRGDVLANDEARWVLDMLRQDAATAYDHYEQMLNEGPHRDDSRRGLARELARMNLPVNIYTQWYWKTDLHNLFQFLSLRADPHAQYEIRCYAQVMMETVRAWVPLAFAAFEDAKLDGAELTAQQLDVIRRMIKGETVSQQASGLSTRKWNELQAVLEDPDEET